MSGRLPLHTVGRVVVLLVWKVFFKIGCRAKTPHFGHGAPDIINFEDLMKDVHFNFHNSVRCKPNACLLHNLSPVPRISRRPRYCNTTPKLLIFFDLNQYENVLLPNDKKKNQRTATYL